MATPKPDIEASRSEQTQGASALSAIPAATTVDRRSGWSKFRKHLKSHNGYLEEDTSDEEPMEHDDEDDDICHTRCKVCYIRTFVVDFYSDLSFYSRFSSHFLRQSRGPLRPSCLILLALLCNSKRNLRIRYPQPWTTASTVKSNYYMFILRKRLNMGLSGPDTATCPYHNLTTYVL